MTAIAKSGLSYAVSRNWYAKYAGELHRLEAIEGGWSREIANRARAFADGVPEVAVSSISSRPTASATGDIPAETLGIKYGDRSVVQQRTTPENTPQADVLTLGDDFWDQAFGRTPAVKPAKIAEEDTQCDDINWDAVMAERQTEQRRR